VAGREIEMPCSEYRYSDRYRGLLAVPVVVDVHCLIGYGIALKTW
jgi:hypothetical protein